jgi:hypothetical protein
MEYQTYHDTDFNKYLEENGFDRLTSEADGLGMRIRYDLDEQAQDILGSAFGGMQLVHEGWNDRKKKTAMIFRELIRPLMIFTLFYNKADLIFDVHIYKEGSYRADYLMAFSNLERDREGKIIWTNELDAMKTAISETTGGAFHIRTREGTSANGLMNVHTFSGRVY